MIRTLSSWKKSLSVSVRLLVYLIKKILSRFLSAQLNRFVAFWCIFYKMVFLFFLFFLFLLLHLFSFSILFFFLFFYFSSSSFFLFSFFFFFLLFFFFFFFPLFFSFSSNSFSSTFSFSSSSSSPSSSFSISSFPCSFYSPSFSYFYHFTSSSSLFFSSFSSWSSYCYSFSSFFICNNCSVSRELSRPFKRYKNHFSYMIRFLSKTTFLQFYCIFSWQKEIIFSHSKTNKLRRMREVAYSWGSKCDEIQCDPAVAHPSIRMT